MTWSNASGWSRSEGWNTATSGGGGGGGGGVTLDPSNTGSGGTLSGGNLTLSYNTGQASSRSTTSHTSGKVYFELIFGAAMTGGLNGGGLANASQSMSSGAIGASANAGGAIYADTIFYINGATTGFISSTGIVGGTVLGIAADIGSGKLWGTTDNGAHWNSVPTGGGTDPAAGTGGNDISALTATGALFAAVHVESNSNSVMTINFGPSYTFTKPTGFSDW